MTSLRHMMRELRHFLLPSGLLFLVWLCSCALYVWWDYKETVRRADVERQNIARLIELQMRHLISTTDSMLSKVHEHVAEVGVRNLAGSHKEWLDISELANALPSMGRIWVFDDGGKAVLSSHIFPPPAVSAAQREYFIANRDSPPESQVFIGEAMIGQSSGRPVFTISQRVNEAGGRFAGVISTSVDIRHLIDSFGQIELGESGAISIIREDGAIIARHPILDALGKRYPTIEALRLMHDAPAASILTWSPIDGILRHASYRKVEGLPLLVFVSQAREEILAPWRMHVAQVVLVSLLLAIITGILLRNAMHALRREKGMLEDIADASARLKVVLDSALDGVVGIDRDGLITFVNPAGASLLGHDVETMIGGNLHVLTHHTRRDGTPYPRAECPVCRMLESGEPCRSMEDVFWRADGTSLPVEFAAAPLADGLGGGVVVFRDISEQMAADKALRESRDLAEAASRAKSQFLANMSHEIRTPMNAILGLSHLLVQAELAPMLRGQVERIHGAAKSLLGILNDILDFSKVEVGKLRLVKLPFRIEHLLDSLRTVCSEASRHKNIEVVFHLAPDVPSCLIGDETRVQQILVNLLGNALKFTESGHVILRVAVSGPSSHTVQLRFEVEDTGIGIPHDKLNHLFQPFTQIDGSITRRFGGTGLGLAISSELASLMGGQIGVESEPGKGSLFWVVLPLEQGQPDVERIDALQDRRSVLVVDDNPHALAIEEENCRSLGWEVVAVESGAAALDAQKAAVGRGRPFDLAILDWQMPAMDGLDTASALRAADPAMPILLLTAYPLPVPPTADVDCVLTKPMTRGKLLEWQVALENRRAVERPVEAVRQRLSGLRVLVAEDNEINQEVARSILEHEGARVTVAGNGREAIELVGEQRFDAVLMDLQMPEIDGYEAARRLRALPGGNALPILAMTANATPEDRERCRSSGMCEHVAKPIDVDHLVACIRRHASFLAGERA